MSNPFRVEYPVRFSDCDPAGIVYFPRLFDFLHRTMEDWFTFGLEERFADFVGPKELGIPTVSTHVEFRSPARLGDTLRLELRVAKLGKSSIELLIDSFVGDAPCFVARHTVCCFSPKTAKSVPIPDWLRTKMAAYSVEA